MKNRDLDQLATEQRHPHSSDLDTLSSEESVRLLLEEDRLGLESALKQSESITKAAMWICQTLESGGNVAFAGAGTSGRLGVIEAAECPPTFGTEPHRIQAWIAGGSDAVFAAREGAEDDADMGAQAAAGLRPGDLLVGISASSVTPWVRGALEQAGGLGARTILLTCASSTGLESSADLVIGLETGPEILTGSTRLKAGSATKAVLNAMTTTAMVRLGKVYQNLMVDLRPGSEKLKQRAVRIVAQAANISMEAAKRLHDAAGGDVKTAIVMGCNQVTAEQARQSLDRAAGRVRAALEDRGER
ncbi:MAG: N-acetylmuramic acid 6-phosphate etherase [Thermoanaerobaculia bacterium]